MRPLYAPAQPKPGIGASASCTVPNGSNLQAAIDAAPVGSTLTVCAGTFGRITINQHLTLVGAGAGNTPSSATILDGGNNGSVVSVAAGVTATLQNLRISGGYAQTGGGILNQGFLTVQGCVITGNATPQATQGTGGGIANIGNGTAMLVSTTIAQNTAFTGGGISHESQQLLTLDRCTVQQNTASVGGGVLAGLGTIAVRASTAIVNNQAEIFGGGLAVLEDGFVSFDATCRVTGNTAQDGLGGGIYNNGTVHLSGAKVSGNTPENCNGANPVTGCSN